MFRTRQNFTLAIPKKSTPMTSIIFTKAIIWLKGPKMLIPLSTWFNSTILMTVFSPNYWLQICCPRSTTSVKLSKEHTGHMGQKLITYSVSCVMSCNSSENGINIHNQHLKIKSWCLLLFDFHAKEIKVQEKNGNFCFKRTFGIFFVCMYYMAKFG